MMEAAQTGEPRWPRSWSLPAEASRQTVTSIRSCPGRLNGSGKCAVDCTILGRGGETILEKADKASQDDGILAEHVGNAARSGANTSRHIRPRAGRIASTSASDLPESAAPDRTDGNTGPWLRVAMAWRWSRPRRPARAAATCMPSGLVQAGSSSGDFGGSRTGEVGHVRPC